MLRLVALLWIPVALQAQFPPLESAIRRGDLTAVANLVRAGADVNARDPAGTEPLLAGVFANKPEIVRFLIANGSQIDARQAQTGGTALLYAVTNGRSEISEVLLAAGARTDLAFRDEETVLHVATRRGDLQAVKLLLGHGASLEAADCRGEAALDTAVLAGREEIVTLLLEHGANPNRVHGRNARGPLQEAAVAGHERIVERLIAKGADVSRRDNSGQSALDLALAYKNGNVVSAFLKMAAARPVLRDQFGTAMESAVAHGRTVIAKMLLDAGWSVNERTSAGSTYLNDAALKGNVAMARLLLERGARIDARNAQGGTPLHDAAISGNVELINLLLDRGAAIDARDNASATPLMLANSLGNRAAAALLVRRGAQHAPAA